VWCGVVSAVSDPDEVVTSVLPVGDAVREITFFGSVHGQRHGWPQRDTRFRE
jgi:hypothetical protein